MNNRVCEILGIEKPVIQAPLNWLTNGRYVAAVSRAGGLGVLGFNAGQTESVYTVEETVESMRREIRVVKGLTDKPFGLGISQIHAVEPVATVMDRLMRGVPR